MIRGLAIFLLLVLVGSSGALWSPLAKRADAAGELTSFVLPSGRRVTTHGPDAPRAPAGLAANLTAQVPAPWLHTFPVSCVMDESSDEHGHVVYARAPDAPDRFAQMNATLQEWATDANTLLHVGSLAFDVATDYKMLCDAEGRVRVDEVVLPTPLANSSYFTIAADAEAAGLTNARAKYWIFYDNPKELYCGEGEFSIDPALSPDNANNHGPSYAVTWPNPGCDLPWTTMMHENGHNLGAVQPLSPNSDRYAHCLDGADVMCYVSVPPVVPLFGVRHRVQCNDLWFDCGNDDYFHPKPPALSYLAQFWNLGSRYDKFLAFADVPSPPANVSAHAEGAGQTRVSWTPAAASPVAPSGYRVYAGNGTLATMRPVLDVPATQTDALLASSARSFVVTALSDAGESRPAGPVAR